jgi:EAL domain-containing protein (putative c-di-GMP-specific phosphodiesterase class I)
VPLWEVLCGVESCPKLQMEDWRKWYASLVGKLHALREGTADGSWCVNLSAEQILDDEIFESVSGYPLKNIVVELLEDPFPKNSENVLLKRLATLRKEGARLALDDVGSPLGADSVWRLFALSPEYTKIDGRFFREMRCRPRELKRVVRFLEESGTEVIIEWVETLRDFHVAVDCGAHYLQGYFLL